MPRINNSLSDPLDFCKACFPAPEDAEVLYANLGDGPDGRGNCYSYNDEHPDYGMDEYFCENCSLPLFATDN